mmetsp:Transcript_30281/g.67856  ORF Transcript_30281/g.67856 Transcript_30281/m.67856 type:complete len:342 (+) Transcript_30281:176-1201(+)
MTVLSVDTGDLNVVSEMASTGWVSDATTNPLFVSQAGLSGDPKYAALVDAAVAYAKDKASSNSEAATEGEVVALAMDRLAVNLGIEITKQGLPGYVSTEVDPRLSFNTEESLVRARRIIAMYEEEGVSRSKVLIKLAATWEGIEAARELEAKDGVTCNLTLIFGLVQAVACAQAGATLISPFTGRILDWHKAANGYETVEPAEDPGVLTCARIYRYFKKYGHSTIVMPASWRPSRGPGFELDEILALAGVDRMTIPPGLLSKLLDSTEDVPRVLDPVTAAAECQDDELCGPEGAGTAMDESTFRLLMNADLCATTKMAEGLQAFVVDTGKLEDAIRAKVAA